MVRPLLIIAGPQQPGKIAPFLEETLMALKLLGGSTGGGVPVTEQWANADGTRHSRQFVHRVYLTAVHADTPARSKVRRAL
jgi:hypothetical protein